MSLQEERISSCFLLSQFPHEENREGSQCSGTMLCAPLALSASVSCWIALLVWALLLILWFGFMAHRALTD